MGGGYGQRPMNLEALYFSSPYPVRSGHVNSLQAVHQNGRRRDKQYEIFLINLHLFT
jgi:hypothetical protein